MFHLLLALILILPFPTIQQTVTFDYFSPSEVLYAGNRIRGARNRTQKDFVLGGLFPIHASSGGGGACGKVRLERGLERMEAMLYSIDTINADNTLLPNITLGYDIRDTCSSENIGLDETVDLVITDSQLDIASCGTGLSANNNTSLLDIFIDAPTSGIIGAAGSRVSVPVASLVRLFTTPQVSYASSSALLSNRDRYGFFHRTIPPDNLQARAMIDMMLHFNWTYVSTVYSVNTYGQPGIDAFHKLANELGICIDIDRGIGDDFTPEQFKKLAETLISDSKANVVILFTSQDNAGSLFKYINASTTKRRFTWIASDSWARSNSVASKYRNIVAGLIGFVPFTRHLDGFHDYFSNLTLLNNNRNPWFKEFFEAVTNCTANNQTACNLTNSVPMHVETYEQGNFIPLVVDAVYTIAHALHNFLMENCELPVQWFSNNRTCLNQSRKLDGSSLLEYIQKSNFTSPTGNRIVFDNEGNVEGLYEVLNYQYTDSNFKFQSMGVWNGSIIASGQELLQLNPIIPFQFGMEDGKFLTVAPESHCTKCNLGNIQREVPSSCCGLCEPCLGQFYSSDPQSSNCSKCPELSWGNNPTTGNSKCIQMEETFLQYSHPYSVLIMIIALAGFGPVLFAVILYIIHWNTPIVKSSGREQMILLLLGISLSLVTPFFYVSPPGKAICGIQRWIIWTSFSIMFSALLVKVVRVARIFLQLRRGAATRIRFTEPRYQILFTLILVLLQWVLLVFSTGLFPPDVHEDVRLNSEKPNETPQLLYTCETENIVILVISVAYQTLLVLLCTILGIISFTYPENFNEAKYIAFCSFSVLVIWIAFIITFFATQATREYHGIVLSLAVVMTGCAVYVTMFCQKIYIIVFRPERNVKNPTTGTGIDTLDATTISRKETWGTMKEVSVDAAGTLGENGQGKSGLEYE